MHRAVFPAMWPAVHPVMSMQPPVQLALPSAVEPEAKLVVIAHDVDPLEMVGVELAAHLATPIVAQPALLLALQRVTNDLRTFRYSSVDIQRLHVNSIVLF